MHNSGYTFIEILIVVIVLSIVPITTLNIGPGIVNLDIEQVTSQVAATVKRVRREALSGNSNTTSCTFILGGALAANHPGITITAQAPGGSNTCQQNCSPGLSSLCVSGQSFCYDPNSTFTFERNSGRLTNAHAIFIVSRSRKIALLVSQDRSEERRVGKECRSRW